jgi:hypothetical protein
MSLNVPFCITSIALVTAGGGAAGGVAALVLKQLMPVRRGNVRSDESKLKSLRRRNGMDVPPPMEGGG